MSRVAACSNHVPVRFSAGVPSRCPQLRNADGVRAALAAALALTYRAPAMATQAP